MVNIESDRVELYQIGVRIGHGALLGIGHWRLVIVAMPNTVKNPFSQPCQFIELNKR